MGKLKLVSTFANMQVIPTDYGAKSTYIGGQDDDQRQYEHEYECE